MWGWGALLTTVAVSCGPAPATLDSLPLPPFAVEGKYNGGFETRVDQRMFRARDQLEPRYGPLEIGDFALVEEGRGWTDVQAFYAQPAVQKTLADAGFVRQALPPNTLRRYELALWTRKRTFGKDEALAVVFVPGSPGDPLNFLLRVHAPSRR